MLIRIILFVFNLFISTSVFAHTSDCNYKGAVTEYKVTLTSASICEDYSLTTGECTGDNDFVVGTYNKTCDIASVAANTDVCSYGSLAGLTLGTTYKYIRVTIARDMNITAAITPTSSSLDTDGNTNADCDGFTIRTESDNTNAQDAPPQGVTEANGSTNPPESQTVTFMTSQGNNTTGCSTECIPQTKDVAVTDCDATTSASDVDSGYGYTSRMCAPAYSVWMGELTSSSTDFAIVYLLTDPFTATAVTPKLLMKFDTQNAISGYYDSDHAPDSHGGSSGFSMFQPQEPIVSISIVE